MHRINIDCPRCGELLTWSRGGIWCYGCASIIPDREILEPPQKTLEEFNDDAPD